MDLQTLFARLKAISTNFTPSQLVSLALSFVLVVGVVTGSTMWLNTPTYALLFADMDQESAGQVVTRLKSMKVQYQLDEGGRAVRVPRSRVDELRLELTSQGLPSSGRVGYELLDKVQFGATDFLEKKNFQRALEGEIARSISTLDQVAGARVHLAMGKESLFGQSQPSKASVVLKLRDNRPVTPSTINAITGLVAASVEGLRPEAVVVVDSHGRPLSRPENDERDPMGGGQIERQQRLESDMAGRVAALLEPVVGPGRVRVNVALKLNPRSRELTEETYDPNTVVRSRQMSADQANMTGAASLGTAPGVAGGIAGARANLPPTNESAPPVGPVAPGMGGSSRTTETTNFEVSRTTTRTIEPAGDIARLSVAVILDDNHEMKADAEGKQVMSRVPRTPEELQKLQTLVAASVGVDETRGDRVTVENVAFDDPLPTEPPPPDFWTKWGGDIQEGGRVLGILVIGICALIFIVRPMMRSISAVTRMVPASGGTAALTAGSAAMAGMIDRPRTVAELESEIEAQMDAAINDKMADNRRLPVLTRRVTGMAQKEPENTAKLVRSWMSPER
jgi:flagellar M-ring protein FliF